MFNTYIITALSDRIFTHYYTKGYVVLQLNAHFESQADMYVDCISELITRKLSLMFLRSAFPQAKNDALNHRLRKREDWTRNFRSFIRRPILAQFTTMTVVHFPGT
jgi:hypothetical protein